MTKHELLTYIYNSKSGVTKKMVEEAFLITQQRANTAVNTLYAQSLIKKNSRQKKNTIYTITDAGVVRLQYFDVSCPNKLCICKKV